MRPGSTVSQQQATPWCPHGSEHGWGRRGARQERCHRRPEVYTQGEAPQCRCGAAFTSRAVSFCKDSELQGMPRQGLGWQAKREQPTTGTVVNTRLGGAGVHIGGHITKREPMHRLTHEG